MTYLTRGSLCPGLSTWLSFYQTPSFSRSPTPHILTPTPAHTRISTENYPSLGTTSTTTTPSHVRRAYEARCAEPSAIRVRMGGRKQGGRDLHRDQDEGAGDGARVRGPILSHRPVVVQDGADGGRSPGADRPTHGGLPRRDEAARSQVLVWPMAHRGRTPCPAVRYRKPVHAYRRVEGRPLESGRDPLPA
jgi:hypothetical protein